MHTNLERLNFVKKQVKEIIAKKQLKNFPEIIAVSKTFSLDEILPLLEAGHYHFGENKIQEAEDKWLIEKKNQKNLKLHMLGKLQSNKAKKAINLFDYIHSLDNEKLALKLDTYQKELNKKLKYFIQINIAEENQKSGIFIKDLDNFYDYCTNKLSLNVIGLMCLPPYEENSAKYFEILKKNSDKLSLKYLSMGMSSDFEEAILNGSTHLRLGTAIFGERKTNQ